jgi:YD repeat-containing protein
MKKYLSLIYAGLIILVCGMLLLVSCQPRGIAPVANHDPGFRPVKLYYENSSGEKAITTYYYDIKGQNYLAHWQLEDSSRSSMNYYEYDTSGNQIRKYREFSDGLISDQHFFYDALGRLVEEDFFRSDSVEGRTDYEYDEQGRCLAARCKGLNGWFHGDLFFRYDPGGMKMGAGIYRGKDSIGFIVYSYDPSGNMTREYWDFNGQWSQSFLYEYQKGADRTYTSSNVFIRENPWFRLKEENYTYQGETGGPSHFQYDEQGRLIEKTFIRADGLSTRTTYVYDSTGILRSSRREYQDGMTADFHYWYSIDRRLLVRTFERSDGGRGSETYRYDDQGLLASGEWENFDNWLTGRLTFSHDERGLLKTGTFSGNDGFDAVLRFEYDLNDNLTAIFWEFSNGGYQQYAFVYESP